jgi:hypothetical protein
MIQAEFIAKSLRPTGKTAQQSKQFPTAQSNLFFSPAAIPINLIQRKCAHCEDEEKKMQRKEINGEEVTADEGFENYIGNLSSGGQPLSNEVRNFYEPRLGYDFSNVKIHTGTVAAKSAQSINALAYTSGNNIVFNSGEYNPQTGAGKKLLAHELTHIAQQNATKSYTVQRQPKEGKDTEATKNNIGVQSGISDLADIADWEQEDFHLKSDVLFKSDPRHHKAINYLIRAKLRIQSVLANGLKWRYEQIGKDKVTTSVWSYKWEFTLPERNTQLERLIKIIDKVIALNNNRDISLLNNQWGTVSVNTTIASAALGPLFAYVESIGMSQKDAALCMFYITTLSEETAAVKQAQHLNYTGTGIYVAVPSVLTNKMHLKIISGFESAHKGEIAGELLSDRFGRFIFYKDKRIYVDADNNVILPH